MSTGRMVFLRRLLALAAPLLVLMGMPSRAEAGPLLKLEFEGVLERVVLRNYSQLGLNVPLQTIDTYDLVPFVASFTFDAAKYPLLAPPVGGSWKEYADVDPQTGGLPDTDPGISTDEWMRGTMTLGGPLAASLDFDRDLTTAMPAGSTVGVEFNGQQYLGYYEGSEWGAPMGDGFFGGVTNSFSFTHPGVFTQPLQPGDPIFDAVVSSLFFGLFDYGNDLYGPGAPMAFVYELADCVFPAFGSCYSYGGLYHATYKATALGAPDFSMYTVTEYSGESMTITSARLRAVPEPGTASLTLMAVALLARRRGYLRTRLSSR